MNICTGEIADDLIDWFHTNLTQSGESRLLEMIRQNFYVFVMWNDDTLTTMVNDCS